MKLSPETVQTIKNLIVSGLFWEPDAKLLGNTSAAEMVKALSEVLECHYKAEREEKC